MNVPDYSRNTIIVHGEIKDLNSFRKNAQGVNIETMEHIDFNLDCFLPVPKDLKTLKEVRSWQFKNWGCKEGIIKADLIPKYENKKLLYATISNGNPPIEALKAISRMYPRLGFELVFEIPSKGASGEFYFKKGERLWEKKE